MPSFHVVPPSKTTSTAVTSARTATPATPVAPAAPIDPLMVEEMIDRLRREQRFGPAVVAGASAAILGAIVWAVVTVVTQHQIGWMAIGVGALVGVSMRRSGRGIEPRFGYVGAGLALGGCVLGNLLAAIGFVAKLSEMSFFGLLGRVDAAVAKELLAATFSPMDLLFYGIAVSQAYRLAFQKVTAVTVGATVQAIAKDSTPPR